MKRPLQTPKSPRKSKRYIFWLVHLIGDEHMPLHCCSLFTSECPTGDEGATPSSSSQPPGDSVDSFWDELLGPGKPQSHLNYAIMIKHKHPRKSLKEVSKARPEGLESGKPGDCR